MTLPHEEKAEGTVINNTTQTVMDEEKKDWVIRQGSQAGSEAPRSDQIGLQDEENAHASDKAVLNSGQEQQQGAEPEVALTRAASETRPLEVIPRSQRRGLFGRFAIIPEVSNPYEYKNSTKWMMTIIVSFAAATSSTGSSIFYRA
jgi:hypothetical protein